MSISWKQILPFLLCAVLLTACAEKEAVVIPEPSAPSPAVETPSRVENSEETYSSGVPLSVEALEEYMDWFSQLEYNGLLRLPYTNGADSEQIAPYLGTLFYDIGETALSEEEYALLESAGMFLELDEFRLSRSFVVDYLVCHLDMPKESAERILEKHFPGVYLPETEAWYMCHGDTAWMPYTFDRGEYFSENETVKLYYVNPFLSVANDEGEVEFLCDQSMVVTISIEGGERRVLANEIIS